MPVASTTDFCKPYRMRIVHLGKFYHPHSGGIESHVRTLAHAQAAQGDDVQVVCISHDPKLPDVAQDGPVAVRRFRPRVSVAKFDWLPQVRRYLDQLDFDVLHVHLPNPAMTLPVLGMKRSRPLVVTYHSDVIGMHLRKWVFAPLNRRLLNRASVIAATNPRLAAASPVLTQHRAQVCSIPMGISLNHFLNPDEGVWRRAAEIRQEIEGPLWLMCGRLVPYKGHAVALDALKQTVGTLVVIGDGPLRKTLQEQVLELQIEARVRFLGHVAEDAEVQSWYLAAAALWMPSILPSEAFGLVQVEAMASGCPVINTDIPGSGVPWVSLHEETGLTVPVHDPVALAKAAWRMAGDDALRDQLAQAARLRARQMFDHQVMAERWAECYRRLVSAPSVSEDSVPAVILSPVAVEP